MNRRNFMLLLGGAVTAARALHAQQKAMPVIGWLSSGSPRQRAPIFAAFHQGLSESGWVEGQNLAIEYRWADGHYDRLPMLAADLVDRKVDVIVTGNTNGITAAKGATATIPIAFFGGGDLMAAGLISYGGAAPVVGTRSALTSEESSWEPSPPTCPFRRRRGSNWLST